MSVEHDLLEAVVALDLQLVDTKIDSLDGEIVHLKIVLQDDPEVLSSCAWSLIYAIGALSFHDARPRGFSDRDFVENDEWTAADMLAGLCYENGRLHFHADYVRGRSVKTTVTIDREGKIVVRDREPWRGGDEVGGQADGEDDRRDRARRVGDLTSTRAAPSGRRRAPPRCARA